MAEEEQATEPKDEHQESADVEEGQEQATAVKNAVTIEPAGPCKKKVLIEIPQEAIQNATDEQYEDLRKEALVPGFRKGRAPRRLLEKRFGKETTEQIKLKLLIDASDSAIKDNKLDVLGEPEIDHEKIELPESGPLKFDFEVEVRPEIDLPPLEGIPLTRTKLEVTDDQVDREIERLQKWSGVWAPREKGPIELDDQIIADVVVKAEATQEQDRPEKEDEPEKQDKAEKQNEAEEQDKAEKQDEAEKQDKAEKDDEAEKQDQPETENRLDNIEIYVRQNGFVGAIPVENLDKLLVGAKAGDVKQTSVEVPKTYFREEYRGKKVNIQITIKDIKWLKPAELDENFLRRFDAENENDLREQVRDTLQSRLEQQVRTEMTEQIYQYLLDNTDFDLPLDIVADHSTTLLKRHYSSLMMRGLPRERIEEQMEQLQASSEQQAKEQFKTFFVMDKVAEELKIEVSDEEINGRIAQLAIQQRRRPERMRDEMERDGSLAQFKLQVREDKCIARLLESAKITEKKAPRKSITKRLKKSGKRKS